MGTTPVTATMNALALVLTALLALAHGQGDGSECECGMFITTWSTEYEVHRLDPFDIDNCNAVEKCNNKCAEEYTAYSNGGDLNHVLGNGYTVGQEMCINLFLNFQVDFISDETVYGYARHCKGPWDYDGQFSINRLCCFEGYHYDCNVVTGAPTLN